jgi:hypothetical protein
MVVQFTTEWNRGRREYWANRRCDGGVTEVKMDEMTWEEADEATGTDG